MISEKEFLVSVRLMTYNHAQYIRKAMDGIMMQKTDFPVEVIVGDDFSNDGTLDIVRSYASTDLIKIRILERSIGDGYWKLRQEKGRLYNFINILENCNAKYVAILDGDDYWIDPLKLQKQVDFLEENSNISICGTNYKIVQPSGDRITSLPLVPFDLKDYFKTNYLGTCTVVLKREALHLDELNYLTEINYGDWAVWSSVLRFGKGINLDFVSAIYNFNGFGVLSSDAPATNLKKRLNDRLILMKYYEKSYHSHIKQKGYQMILGYFFNALLLKIVYFRSIVSNISLIVKFIKA